MRLSKASGIQTARRAKYAQQNARPVRLDVDVEIVSSIVLAPRLPSQVAAPGRQPVCRLPLQILKRAKEIVSIPVISAKWPALSNGGSAPARRRRGAA
ncbi:hypothetical protein [Kaistia adipata]|uniref:hypothetical protein n=1 Tax=Kaistia adipata TaxID=166954 RepID=UPI0012EBB662|nr:hypothetical protein [Kaistia adipata]